LPFFRSASLEEHSRRLAGIGGVALVHLLLLSVILSGLPKIIPTPRAVREMFIALMPKPKPEPRPLPRPAHPPVRRPIWSPDTGYTRLPAIDSPSAPAKGGLSIPLFSCTPEKFAGLSPEDQAKCAGTGVMPPQTGIAELRSHVRDPTRRAAELAARRTPVRVDCTHAKTTVIQNITQQTSVSVDLLCAGKALLRATRR